MAILVVSFLYQTPLHRGAAPGGGPGPGGPRGGYRDHHSSLIRSSTYRYCTNHKSILSISPIKIGKQLDR